MRTSLAVIVAAVPAIAVSVGVSGLAQTPKTAPKATPKTAPEQQVTPPESRYWVGATTGSGMLAMGGMTGGGRPSMGSLMKMATSGLPSASQTLELKLGTSLSPTGEPEAFHSFPAASQVNKPIFLQTPEPGRPGTEVPGTYKAPKGQITFYWGCGEKAGPGQPMILTFDKLMRGENDPELQALQAAVGARAVRTPSTGNSKTYGDWPHEDRKKRNKDLQAGFPMGSTLAGQHVIEGTYTPRIDFTLPDDKTFMEPVRYSSTAVQASGAVALSWNAPARATGYSLGVMAPEKVDDESANIVMWSSAERPATFIQMEHLTPGEVKRLVDLKAVLPATTTSCAVPAEVVKATRNGSMLMFTAYGDEATFIHPARPADPTMTWDQEWFARVSFKAVRMDMISPEGVMDITATTGGTAAAGAPDKNLSDEEYCAQLAAQQASKPSVADAIPGGRLLGRFGRKKQEAPPPSDPRCANVNKK